MSHQPRANGALLAKLAAAAITYGFTLLLARLMSPDSFGQVVFFLNAAVLMAVVGARGQQLALLRFLPGLTGFGQHRRFAATWLVAAKRARTGTLLVTAAFVALAFLVRQAGGLNGFSTATILLGGALILAVGWVDFLAHFARALGRIQLSLWPKELLWRSFAGLAVLALAMIVGRTGLNAELVLTILAASLALLCVIVRATLGLGRLPNIPPAPPHAGWADSRTPFWVNSVSNVFLANADVVAVGLLFGATEAGIYFLANRLAMLLAFFMVAHNVVLAPAVSRRFHQGQLPQIETIACRAARKMTVPTIALGVVLVGMADPILALFGPNFATAAPVLWVLVAAGIVNAATGPSDILLNLCGKERVAMRVSLASLVLSTVLIAGLGMANGPLGVALAVLVATCARKAMYGIALWQHLAMRGDAGGGATGPNPLAAGHG